MKIHKTIFMLTLSMNAYAIEFTVSEGEYNASAKSPSECFDVGDNIVRNTCIAYFQDQSSKQLEETLESMKKRVTRDSSLLNEAQKNWASFKASECKLESIPGQAYRDPETQTSLLYEACSAEMNIKRVEQLKSIKLGCDSCIQ